MAQKVVVELVDDLDGTASEDISMMSFGLDGAEYGIDLTERTPYGCGRAGRLCRCCAPDPVNRRGATRRRSERTKAIREWAQEHAYGLASRTRTHPR